MEVLCRLSYSSAGAMIATGRARTLPLHATMRGMRRAIVLAFIALAASGCGSDDPGAPGRVVFTTSAGPVRTAALRVADTSDERVQGLMGVKTLGIDEGEVFLFEGSTLGFFWMKDTLIPLSIAFWDDSGKIVDIIDMEPCPVEPCQKYAATAPYTAALEMNQGWFDRNGVRIGDHAEFSYQTP